MEKAKFSIRYKITLYVAFLLIITITLIYFYILFFGKNIILEQAELRYVSLGNNLAYICKEKILKEDWEGLKLALKETLEKERIISIIVSEFPGNIGKIKLFQEEKKIAWIGKPFKKIYHEENTLIRRGREHSQLERDIFIAKDRLVKLRIIYSHREINKKIGRIGKDLIYIFFSILGLALIGVIILTNFIVNPLIRITREVSLVGAGDFNREIKVKSNDELKLLAENFNRMVLNLKRYREQIEDYSRGLEKKVSERTKELKEAHNRIVRSEKMAALGQLASSVSHELRNPLGAIKLVTFYLKEKLKEIAPNLVRHIEDIEISLNSAQKIISNILYFSKPSKLVLKYVNINELIEEILESHAIKSLFKNIKVEKRLDNHLPLVKLDKDQIIQVIENLLINAHQAISKEGKIVLKSYTQRKNKKMMVRIDLEDNGCGIPEEEIQNLFKPFFSNKPKGIGLGLSISKDIVERHKGEILVESRVNKGSIFSILLPFDERKNEG